MSSNHLEAYRISWLERVVEVARRVVPTCDDCPLDAIIREMDKAIAEEAVAYRFAQAAEAADKRSEQLQTIGAILAWAEDNPKFDPQFIQNLGLQVTAGRVLTLAQEEALERTIEKWRIDVADYS